MVVVIGGARALRFDSDGDEVQTFSSEIPEKKDDRDGHYITAAAGMNSFQWPMTYPSGVKMLDTEYHKPAAGPLARPGRYEVRLTVGDWSMTQPFELLKDPRVATSDADLAEQFEALLDRHGPPAVRILGRAVRSAHHVGVRRLAVAPHHDPGS